MATRIKMAPPIPPVTRGHRRAKYDFTCLTLHAPSEFYPTHKHNAVLSALNRYKKKVLEKDGVEMEFTTRVTEEHVGKTLVSGVRVWRTK